jgi:hypothetical protein
VGTLRDGPLTVNMWTATEISPLVNLHALYLFPLMLQSMYWVRATSKHSFSLTCRPPQAREHLAMMFGMNKVIAALLLLALTLFESATAACNVTFKGKQLTFQACRMDLDASVSVYWNIDKSASTITTLFSTPATGGYVGWGWGLRKMVPGAAAVAVAKPDGTATLQAYNLAGESSGKVTPDLKAIALTNGDADLAHGVLSGLFTQPLSSAVSAGPTGAIWARGGAKGAVLDDHSKARGSRTLDLSATSSGGDQSTGVPLERVFVVHGVMMVAAWLGLAPLGIFIMRYMKRFNPAAFQTHRALMVTMFGLAVAAFTLGLAKGAHTERAHLWVGAAAMIAATMQVIGGVLRPTKGHQLRGIFTVMHSWTGRLGWTLAVVDIVIGLRIADAARWTYYACVAPVAVFVVAMVGFSFLRESFPVAEKKWDGTADRGTDTEAL